MLQLRLLGAPKALADGSPVTDRLPGKAQAILYYMATTGQPQPRTVLATLLWGDVPESAARTNLRKALAALRQELDPYLQIERQSVAFHPETDLWVDVVEFQTILVDASTKADPERLQTAIDLYQGDFLTGFYMRHAPDFETWMYAEQGRLRELMIQALHTLATHFAEEGNLARGIATVRRLLTLEPWREEAHRQLMLLLAQDGQRGAALAQYETCRQVLEEELGVEPGRETIALYERIRDGKLSRGAALGQAQEPEQKSRGAEKRRSRGEISSPAPQPPGPAPPRNNLPQQPTSFVKREQELAEIRQLLLDEPGCRMVTLVGPGGIGKTRLALAVAADVVGAFPQGVCFVPLIPVSRAEFIIPAMADALDFKFSGGRDPKTQLLNYLRGQKLLLVLDNFEHLLPPKNEPGNPAPGAVAIENGADLLSEILTAAPEVTLLVTSRQRLKLQEEWSYEVPGLDFPTATAQTAEVLKTSEVLAAYSAIHLFVQRARRAKAGFNLTPEDMPDVVRICQLVEGMPLALELAAPWIRLMTCREIADEIEHNLDFLATTMRNVPDRHRSLRAVLEQTWRRLPAAEQTILSKLAVFQGGCLRQAAEQVAGASLPVLASLVDGALLRRTHNGRYELHELIRQFAMEQLQTTPAEYERIRDRHAGFFASFLQHREVDLKGRRQGESLAEIAADLDNIRTGWQWLVQRRNVEGIRQSLESLFLFYEIRGLAQEGEAAFRHAAAAFNQATTTPPDTAQTILLAQLLGRQGNLAIRLGRYDEGLELMRQGVSLLRRVEAEAGGELARALCYLGQESYFQGDYRQSQQLLQESLQLATGAGDLWLQGVIWQCLGQTAEFQGDYTEAGSYFQKSLAVFEKLGERRAKSFAQNNWGRVAYALGEYARAEQLINAALQVREALQDKVGIAYLL